jgi:sterol desaturase/sphingolipid hydroxylase (fatty acid hydroxylase superfamily)
MFELEVVLNLLAKQKQFNDAMALYNSHRKYKLFGNVVSVANVTLQIYLFYRLGNYPIGFAWQLLSLVAAWVIADFVNGLVHMYMDDNDSYESIWGPLVANFHLHHKHPQYTKNNLLLVYFNETGSKIWLIGYLFAVALLFKIHDVEPVVLTILIYVGIFSSLAEVSHYLCHSSNSREAKFLASVGILLTKRHHASHHLQDNINYAFLNGLTDPLLNLIAAKFCKGYKQNTDLHFAKYVVAESEKRLLEADSSEV